MEYINLRDGIRVNQKEFVSSINEDIQIENEKTPKSPYKHTFSGAWRDLENGYILKYNEHEYSFATDVTGTAVEIAEYIISDYEEYGDAAYNICEILRGMSEKGKREFVKACKSVSKNSDGTFTLREGSL